MITENRQAVVDVQQMFLPLFSKSGSTNQADINPDAIFGNERLLTPKLVNKVVAAKKNHRYAVFLEQARQETLGKKDPDAIARASQQYSRGGVGRARAIGLLQSMERESSMALDLKKMLQR